MKPKMRTVLAGLLAAVLPVAGVEAQTANAAAGGTRYALYAGAVTFSAPAEWPAIMQKVEGTPQFIAFLIKDPADPGSDEATRVSVEAKLLNDASTFPALVNAATDKVRQMQGYEARPDAAAGALHYLALDGRQRFEFREAWYLESKILVHIRCARPLLATTTPQWTAAYEAGCAQVMRTAKPR